MKRIEKQIEVRDLGQVTVMEMTGRDFLNVRKLDDEAMQAESIRLCAFQDGKQMFSESNEVLELPMSVYLSLMDAVNEVNGFMQGNE